MFSDDLFLVELIDRFIGRIYILDGPIDGLPGVVKQHLIYCHAFIHMLEQRVKAFFTAA